MNKKISIIIPVHNAQEYLQKCLDSIINQTLKEIEIICVNDSSTDNTVGILDNYQQKDSRIKIINTDCKCSGGARNRGLEAANGEYIGFVDADDWVDKDYFEKLYITAKENSCDIAATSSVVLIENGKEKSIKYVGATPADNPVNTIEKKKKCIIATGICWNKIYRKDFLEKNNIHFKNIHNPSEDNYFSIQAIILADNILFIDTTSYYYRFVCNSQTKARKTVKDFWVTDIYKQILDVIDNKNLDSQWKDVILQRAAADIKLYYSEMDKATKKKFSKHLKKTFPEVLKSVIPKNSILKKIFSMTNHDIHKVITIIGIKLKIKNKRLIKKIEQQKQMPV